MVITKMALPRRTFLRGTGTVLALPLLDAMVPAATVIAKTAARPTMRLGFVYAANGIQMEYLTPKGEGTTFELTPTLSPLAKVRDSLTVVTGLSNLEAAPKDVSAGPHARGSSAWLSGTRCRQSQDDVEAGKTIDQYAADVMGHETPLRSLELGIESNTFIANCESGYSCVYESTFSWRTPTLPLFMENNPRTVFERLFGENGPGAGRVAQVRRQRGVLDSVSEEMARLQKTLGARDRVTMNEYLDSVRDVERRLELIEQQAATSALPPLAHPLGVPGSYDDHAKLMFDLQLLAYQADVTRVTGLQLCRDHSYLSYPWIGVAEGHHDLSHHQNNPERKAKYAKINQYQMTLFAAFVEKMRATPDGDGSLLDHTILLYGSGLSDGDKHSIRGLPVLLVGGGCGQLQGGRHIRVAADTPMMNLGVTLLDKVGAHVERVGDSTGRIAEL